MLSVVLATALSSAIASDVIGARSKWLLLSFTNDKVDVEQAALSEADPNKITPLEQCEFEPVPSWCNHVTRLSHPQFGWVSFSLIRRDLNSSDLVATPFYRVRDPRNTRSEWLDDAGNYAGAFLDGGDIDRVAPDSVGSVAVRVPLDVTAIATHLPPTSPDPVASPGAPPRRAHRTALAAALSVVPPGGSSVVVPVPSLATLSAHPTASILGGSRRSATTADTLASYARSALSLQTPCAEWGAFGCPDVTSDIYITPSRTLNIVVLPAGFKATERAAFESIANDVRRVTRTETTFEPFNRYSGAMNFHTVWLAALESGVSEPLKGIDRSSTDPLRCKYGNSANTERGVQCDKGRVWSLASYAPSGVNASVAARRGIVGEMLVLVVVNSRTYGGTGSAGVAVVAALDSSDRAKMLNVAIHELGHAQAGLADEYSFGTTTQARLYWPNCQPIQQSEKVPWNPWIPNGVTSFPSGSALKPGEGTHNYFPQSDSLPLPVPVCIYDNYYKPTSKCIMSSTSNSRFCPACRQALILSFYESGLALHNAACPQPQEITVITTTEPFKVRLNALVGGTMKFTTNPEVFVVTSYVDKSNILRVSIMTGATASSVEVPANVLPVGDNDVIVAVIDATSWVPEGLRAEHSAFNAVPRAAWRTIYSLLSLPTSTTYSSVQVTGTLEGAFSYATVRDAATAGLMEASSVYPANGGPHSMIQSLTFKVRVVASTADKQGSGCKPPASDGRCVSLDVCTICTEGTCTYAFEHQPFDVAVEADALPEMFWVAIAIAALCLVCAAVIIGISYWYVNDLLNRYPKPLRPAKWQGRIRIAVMVISIVVTAAGIAVLCWAVWIFPELHLFSPKAAIIFVCTASALIVMSIIGFPAAHLEWRVLLAIGCFCQTLVFVAMIIATIAVGYLSSATNDIREDLERTIKIGAPSSIVTDGVYDLPNITKGLSSGAMNVYDFLNETWRDALDLSDNAICAFQGSYECSGFATNCLAFDERILDGAENVHDAMCPLNCDIGNLNAEPCLDMFIVTMHDYSFALLIAAAVATFIIGIGALLQGILACTIQYNFYSMTPDSVKAVLSGTPAEANRRVHEELDRMHPDDIAALHREFQKVDADGSGVVNAAELQWYFQRVLSWDVTLDFAQKIIDSVDDEGDGLNYDEFLALHSKVAINEAAPMMAAVHNLQSGLGNVFKL